MNSGAAIAAALGAAASFAVAALIQQEATQQVSDEKSLSLRLLTDLLHRPKWLAGIALLLTGFGLQALALANGPVALVQPIVITELAFAIPLGLWRGHQRAGLREWTGIAAVVVGVSLFLWVSAPAPGIPDPDNTSWLAALVPVAAAAAAAVLVGATRRDRSRAMFLGAAAGLAFGLLAVLTKATMYLLSLDVGGAFTHWQPYIAVAVGISALVVSQSAYQAGPLAYSMPFIGVLEPLVAVVIGDTVLGEAVRLSGASLILVALSAAVAIVGINLLTTSRIVLRIYEHQPPTTRPDPAAAGAGPGAERDERRGDSVARGNQPRRRRRGHRGIGDGPGPEEDDTHDERPERGDQEGDSSEGAGEGQHSEADRRPGQPGRQGTRPKGRDACAESDHGQPGDDRDPGVGAQDIEGLGHSAHVLMTGVDQGDGERGHEKQAGNVHRATADHDGGEVPAVLGAGQRVAQRAQEEGEGDSGQCEDEDTSDHRGLVVRVVLDDCCAALLG